MNNNEIDKIIKDSIAINLNGYELRNEVFTKIEDNIKKRKNYKIIKGSFYHTKLAKEIVAFTFAFIILSSLTLLISPNARVFATEAINAIRTIFTINDKGQIVESENNMPILNQSYVELTDLGDTDIRETVGFNVSIPVTLPEEFLLSNKCIGVILGKNISYETAESIKLTAQKAIFDDAAFKSLKKYNPSKCAGGIYSNGEGKIVVSVNTLNDRYYRITKNLKKSYDNFKEIKIGNIKGIWLEQKRPIYNTYFDDLPDMTQKPVKIINTYDVAWVSNDLMYFISTAVEMNTNNYKLTPEIGERIAKSIMESQK